MRATEKLRRLLDERGTEHYDYRAEVWWGGESSGGGGAKYTACEQTDGLICVEIADLTPEQAIAATLGVEPDEAAMVKLHDRMNAALLEYERAQGIEKRDGDGGVVVPFVAEMHSLLEEAAALGSCNCTNDCTNSERTGTCHIKPWKMERDTGFYDCMECECGYVSDVSDWAKWHFCPNCGRRIVEPTTNDVGAEVGA